MLVIKFIHQILFSKQSGNVLLGSLLMNLAYRFLSTTNIYIAAKFLVKFCYQIILVLALLVFSLYVD